MSGKPGRSGGRNKKPAALHIVDGTFRPDRHGAKDAARRGLREDRTERVPVPPSWLPEAAKGEWKRLAPRLHARRLLGAKHRALFAAYCEAWGLYRKAVEQLEAEGLVVEGANGLKVRNPVASILNQTRASLRTLAVEFGLSPLGEARVDPSTPGRRESARDLPPELDYPPGSGDPRDFS